MIGQNIFSDAKKNCYSRDTAGTLFRRMHCTFSWNSVEIFPTFVTYLDEVRRDDSTKKLGVYVAREESYFWASGNLPCLVRPFVIPAVSERPGLLALPDLTCKPSSYGYADYKNDEYAMSASPRVSHEVLMSIAQKAGLEGYVDITRKGWTVYRRDKQNSAITEPSGKLLAK